MFSNIIRQVDYSSSDNERGALRRLMEGVFTLHCPFCGLYNLIIKDYREYPNELITFFGEINCPHCSEYYLIDGSLVISLGKDLPISYFNLPEVV